jgi:hypothetical protein
LKDGKGQFREGNSRNPSEVEPSHHLIFISAFHGILVPFVSFFPRIELSVSQIVISGDFFSGFVGGIVFVSHHGDKHM